ncbi:chemotaxis protein CheC [Heyndrickxia ginsengihumi]|uniref:Chemotaxis protein CheC n=1 Tax=Heyndrickxia ginsengihumi TaxID=363870 RepID=A0A0A6VE08_9BACI|nr:chemotaxis protein CheC [Heyndrickxia ginsengihumi]KHD86520.1 chemotaxis protein CheY [Heyndrickxia ginsengihumi]MBE6182776.1 chemotaxis protein CheC [Bacillus sp. (in: firmicutes)]MCM3022516.1 chemotaxis protein CheC [Heyndrickxia ginsengihumi]NEY19636.1 chemotaxis protein CheC [Heyndrickxia ginsengihumi]
MDIKNKITSLHLDALKEIGNIGAGHAATALSKLLNKKIDMKVPDVHIASFDEIMELIGGAEIVVVSVFLRIEGEAPGNIFFIVPIEQGENFIRSMTGDTTFSFLEPPYSELGLSAMLELGNILSGSYLTALSDFTQLDMYPSVPALSIDMFGSIISYGLIELSQVSDYAIVVDTVVNDGHPQNSDVKGHFFLFPDPDSYEKIFRALRID